MQRRFFLTATASLLMASGFLSSPVFAATRVMDTDLVIVGGGLSGIAAAAEATDKGLKPVVLEKLAILGGAGNFPEGSLGIGTRYQKEHGIKWDVQRTVNRFLEFNHYRTNPNVIRQLIAESGSTIDWVVDKGVTIRGIRTIMPEEESFHCWHLFKGGASTVVAKLAESAKAKGATILTETPAKKLILTNGRVTGVEAVDTKTGETVVIRAKKVILATGGFAANPGMIQQYVPDSSDPSVSEPIWLRSALIDGRTGDGINMAMKVGGATAGMSQVVGNAPYLPDRPPINQFNGEDWLKQGRCALAQPWLWIDRNGERFFNESRGSVFTEVYAAMTAAGGIMYNILDQAKFDQLVATGPLIPFNAIVTVGTPLKALPKTFEEGMKRGWAFKADTLEDLAMQIGVPFENLKATMEKVNEYAKTGVDAEFGRKKEHLAAFDMEKGPYYALKGIRTYFLTLGGIKINRRFEALNGQGDSIPNLYMAGADMGGLFMDTDDIKVEGATSSFALTSGRLAARYAMDAIKAGR